MRRVIAVALAALALCPARLLALEVDFIDARVIDHRYHIQLRAIIAAPAERVARVLTDYPRYAELDPRIRSSEVIGTHRDGQVLLRTRVRACAAVFCRNVERTERVTQEEGRLVAEIVPGAGDMRRGVARTQWRGEGNRTRIWYQADFEPGFRVPDLIARRYAAGSLRDSVLALFENVEEKALGRAD